MQQRIDSGYGNLTRQEQHAADFILDHLDDLAVFSATEIAVRSGVSKATVSRLFRRLGFADAQEVREQARASRNSGVPVGAAGVSGGLTAHVESEHSNFARLVAALDDGRLERAAALIADARRVTVVGFRNSYPVALHLRLQLAQLRDDVSVAPQPGQSVGEEMAGLESGDLVVLFGFRRRPAGFAALLATLKKRRIPVLLIADQSLRGDTGSALVLACPIESVSPFDSYASAMSLVNLLAAGVLRARPTAGRARVGDVTTLYGELGELE